ncbi:MAG: A/G-specific adenine glycosylase [Ignisphaera sp.]
MILVDRDLVEVFRQKIIDWYSVYGVQDLPWRSTTNPWHILVAGLLLKNTRVEQVTRVYQKFLDRFPNPKALSDADTEEVKDIIYSLGMQNRRAVELKKLVQIVVERFKGSIPCSRELLKELPGVGKYIASEVLLVACSQPMPLLDRNMARVLGRVFLGVDPKVISSELQFLAESIVPRDSQEAKRFNYGILDMAREICRPRNPRCVRCPVNEMCTYYRKSRHIA